jgi:hypothetical protein
MTYKRAALTTAVALLVSEMLAVAVHGFILANDYPPFYGTLLRPLEQRPPGRPCFCQSPTCFSSPLWCGSSVACGWRARPFFRVSASARSAG